MVGTLKQIHSHSAEVENVHTCTRISGCGHVLSPAARLQREDTCGFNPARKKAGREGRGAER